MAGAPSAPGRRSARAGQGRAVTQRHATLKPRIDDAEHVVHSICPYCAVGCGQLVYVKDGEVTQIEGDPASPISRGRLCPKGAGVEEHARGPAAASTRSSTAGRTAPSGRSSRSTTAMEMIADRVIETRDATWQERRRRAAREAHAGDREPRRRDARQRGELPDQEALHGARRRPGREPGPHMTQLHGARSGHLVRTRRRHRLPAGPAELRLHRDHGLEHGRDPPGRLPVGDGGAGAGREVIHVDPRFTRTSAMATKLRRHPRRHRHRLPRRDRQLHPRARALVPRVRQVTTPTPR